MLWSKLFIPTLRENPAEAEVASHQLLLRAGYVRQLSAGIYSYLFLAQRALLKITAIVRQEMDAIGAQELLLPALNPGRSVAGIRPLGRHGRQSVPIERPLRARSLPGHDSRGSHDRASRAANCAATSSFPQIWYQIQTKFRDEPRPKSGLLRVRQFIMKDSYTFDMDAGRARCRLRQALRGLLPHFRPLRPGIHGRGSAFRRHGRQPVARVHGGVRRGRGSRGYLRAAAAMRPTWRKPSPRRPPPRAADPAGDLAPEEFHTPGRKTIAEVAAFTGLPETSQMKSLVLVADGKPVLVLLRGDHQLSETKLGAIVNDPEFRPAHPEEIREWFGADAGSLGPVGVNNMPILADRALAGRRNMIAGANKRRLPPAPRHAGRRFPGRDPRPAPGGRGRPLRALRRAARHPQDASRSATFSSSATSIPNPWGCACSTPTARKSRPSWALTASASSAFCARAIELYHDKDGMILPASIAPFQVVVTPANNADAAQTEAARAIYASCLALGLDALLDDRDERPGVKFKDADLIGIPFRVVVGKKLAGGMVELVERKTRQSADVPVEQAAGAVKARLSGPAGEKG